MKSMAWTLLILLVTMKSSYAQMELLMIEEPGCHWCAKWHRVIGPIYPKTAEGKTAPLALYQLGAIDDNYRIETPVRFTPTFILVEDDVEKGRIIGYPGEDNFWALLGMLFEKANLAVIPESN